MTSPFDVLEPGRPYFPALLAGVQSPLQRYLVMPTVVHFLKATQPVSVLEIGSWIGCSALVWAEAIERFYPGTGGSVLCVDTWQPYLTAKDDKRIKSKSYDRMTQLAESGHAYQLFLHNTRCGPKSVPIQHLRGTSSDVLPTLADGGFDIVYVDGDHAYEHVRADLALSIRLVRDGGFICGDDLELQWSKVDHDLTIRSAATDMILDAGGVPYHPGVTRAVGETFGDVSSYQGFWAMQKHKDGFRKADLGASMSFVPTHLAEAYEKSGLAPST